MVLDHPSVRHTTCLKSIGQEVQVC